MEQGNGSSQQYFDPQTNEQMRGSQCPNMQSSIFTRLMGLKIHWDVLSMDLNHMVATTFDVVDTGNENRPRTAIT